MGQGSSIPFPQSPHPVSASIHITLLVLERFWVSDLRPGEITWLYTDECFVCQAKAFRFYPEYDEAPLNNVEEWHEHIRTERLLWLKCEDEFGFLPIYFKGTW